MEEQSQPSERVLNPMLYAALKQRFGRVIVANRGAQPSPAFPSAFATRDGNMRIGTNRGSWGEYYRVCCPYCPQGDDNFHLWVNHLFGTTDDKGRDQKHLAVCYRECLSNPATRAAFYDSVLGLVNRNARGIVLLNPGDESADILAAVAPPGKIMPITQVSPQNAARIYLTADRDFDVAWLEKNYEVGVVMDVTDGRHNTMLGRVYMPIRMNGELVGWQGRYPDDRDLPGRPKYYNLPNMPRRLMLYNWHIAKHWPFICIAEGSISAWRVGEPCVAILGKSISIAQRQLLREALGKPIFLMVESKQLEEWQEIENCLRQDGHQTVIPVVWPPGYDPANYTHDVVVNFIRNTAWQSHLQLIEW
jgi:hypothetical protein